MRRLLMKGRMIVDEGKDDPPSVEFGLDPAHVTSTCETCARSQEACRTAWLCLLCQAALTAPRIS